MPARRYRTNHGYNNAPTRLALSGSLTRLLSLFAGGGEHTHPTMPAVGAVENSTLFVINGRMNSIRKQCYYCSSAWYKEGRKKKSRCLLQIEILGNIKAYYPLKQTKLPSYVYCKSVLHSM